MAVFALEVARHKPRKKKPAPAETEATGEPKPKAKASPSTAETETTGEASMAEKPRAKQSKPAEAKKPDAKATAAKPKRKASKPLPEVPPVELSAAEAAQKLTELRAAAASFQEKLDALEQLPENERYGADFTRKLLNNTLRQIEALEGQGE